MQLHEYISATFPGLHLTPPLFYNWPIGIRFELGVDQPGISYDEIVLHRACSLYEAAFAQKDLSFIVSGTVRYSRIKGRVPQPGINSTSRRSVFQLSKRYSLGFGGPAGRQRVITNRDEDELEITTLKWAEISPRAISYDRVLQAKAINRYNLRHPYTDDRVYFVNRTRGLIFHMYDDRGLDIIASSQSSLRTLYEAHNAWILDYDRERIEKIFRSAM